MSATLPKSTTIESSKRRFSQLFGNTAWYIVVIVLSVIMLLPLLWMLTIALKSNNDI
jgi:multiple sugar transport system permease protein